MSLGQENLDATPLGLIDRKAALEAILDLYNRGCISNVACVEVADRLKALPSHSVQADAMAAVEARQAEWRELWKKHQVPAMIIKANAADEILAILKSTRGTA